MHLARQKLPHGENVWQRRGHQMDKSAQGLNEGDYLTYLSFVKLSVLLEAFINSRQPLKAVGFRLA
jgi:hypothetical protein